MNQEERKAYNQQYHQENKHRAKRIYFSLTPAQYQELEKRAKAEGENINTLAKNMMLAYHQQAPILSKETREGITAELRELKFLLLNATSNINQIACYSNTIRKMIDENGLLSELQKMETTIKNFVNERTKQ